MHQSQHTTTTTTHGRCRCLIRTSNAIRKTYRQEEMEMYTRGILQNITMTGISTESRLLFLSEPVSFIPPLLSEKERKTRKSGRQMEARGRGERRGERKGAPEQWCQTGEHWSSDGGCPSTITAFEEEGGASSWQCQGQYQLVFVSATETNDCRG